MFTKQLRVGALLQTNRALLSILYLYVFICPRRPSKVFNASIDDFFFFPLDFHDLFIFLSDTVGGTWKEASFVETTKEDYKDSASNGGGDDDENCDYVGWVALAAVDEREGRGGTGV